MNNKKLLLFLLDYLDQKDDFVFLWNGLVDSDNYCSYVFTSPIDCIYCFDKQELIVRIRSLLRIKSLHDSLEESYSILKEMQYFKDMLGGMLAHDINNILTAIRGNSELILMDSKKLMPEIIKMCRMSQNYMN